jgi:hypothetical protein
MSTQHFARFARFCLGEISQALAALFGRYRVARAAKGAMHIGSDFSLGNQVLILYERFLGYLLKLHVVWLGRAAIAANLIDPFIAGAAGRTFPF